MKKCPQCSAQAIDGAKFCTNCGSKLDLAQTEIPVDSPPQNGAEDPGEIERAVSVTVLGKGFRPKVDGVQDYQTADIQYRNTGTRGVQGFKGVIQFFDMFGEHIYSIKFQVEKPIAPGKTRTETILWTYNKFIAPQVKLYTTQWSNLTTKCQVIAVIFEDGTKIVA